jgi:hypothetical protein
MSLNIKPSRNRILEPFAVFGIVLGVASVAIRVYRAMHPLDPQALHTLFSVILLTAAVAGLAYSLVVLRSRLTTSWGDRALYFLVPCVFLAIIGCVVYISTQ